MYGLSIVSAAAAMPLSVGELRRHLRIDETDEDVLLEALIKAATQYYQKQTLLQLISQTYDLTFGRFPCHKGFFRLPRAPVTSITSITYISSAGVSTVLSSDDYVLQGDRVPAEVRLDFGSTWPTTRDVPTAVTLRFVAGYAAAADVPDIHKAAIKLLAGAWYEHREEFNVGSAPTLIPIGAERIITMEAIGDHLSLGLVDVD